MIGHFHVTPLLVGLLEGRDSIQFIVVPSTHHSLALRSLAFVGKIAERKVGRVGRRKRRKVGMKEGRWSRERERGREEGMKNGGKARRIGEWEGCSGNGCITLGLKCRLHRSEEPKCF